MHTRGFQNWRKGSRTPACTQVVCALLGLVVILSAGVAQTYTPLTPDQLGWVNVDHAPIGTCSTITYGLDGPNSATPVKGDWCGLGMSSPAVPAYNFSIGGGGGVVFAISNSAGLKALPFLLSPASLSQNAAFFPNANVHRKLTPCTDEWSVDNTGLSFTHYTPVWNMSRLETATMAEKKRFFLPATWLVFTVNNTNAAAEDFYFGLPAACTQLSLSDGAYQGFAVGEAVFAVPAGSCELLTGAPLTAILDGMTKGFVFHLAVAPGESRTLTVVLAFYRSAVVDSRISARYYYTSLYPGVDSVVETAFAGVDDAQQRCNELASAIRAAGLNEYRQFLAAHSLHSYMANTACLIDPLGGVHWRVTEGSYGYINTFDLTVDLAFYEALLHPWTLRNVLDTYSGAINGAGYSFDHPLYSPSGALVSDHGFSFHHDLGNWPTSHPPGTDPTFDDYMGEEQLQNWVLDAGLYWSHTIDHAWLTNNAALLQTCLASLLARDSTNALERDGIPQNINRPELTTFDDIDSSLAAAPFSGRLTVRNWACYVALEAMFGQVGNATDAATCRNMAAVVAQTITNRWNTYTSSLGYIPALLDGSNLSATIPMVEGLAYPAQMGLTNAVDRVGGPYAGMLQALSNHMAAVLVPGRCLNAISGAWDMTSSGDYFNSHNTWQSKIYTAQYVAEHVLGLGGPDVNGAVDQVHASIQVQNAFFLGWSDQTDASGANKFIGSTHYPRGVTSALWWLGSAAPIPPTGPNLTAVLNGVAVTIAWPASHVGWILQTNTVDVASSSHWADVPGSEQRTTMSFPIAALANGREFFRLRHP